MTTLKCISPIDGSVIAERDTLDFATMQDKVAKSKQAQKQWASRPLKERIEIVKKGVEGITSQNDEAVVELAKMMGRPVRYGGEFGGFVERGTYMAEIAEKSLAPIVIEDSAEFDRHLERVPHGVVFVISPWNYPYMTAVSSIAPALIAGNSVILKGSEQTLLVGERIEKSFIDAGVPAELLQNVCLNHDVAGELISGNYFDFISFTGSVGGGLAVQQSAAKTFVNVSTELGGKDAGYVMEDADLDVAVDTLVDGAMFNSGQSCCGIERIYVHESLYDEFVAKAVEIVKGYKLGNPLEQDTDIGPMAAVRFADEVRKQVADAVADGAVAHIKPMDAEGDAYVTPQILTNVNHNMTVMKQETFGPVVGIMKVSSDDEAIELINDSDYGLTCSLWTKDHNRAKTIGDKVETGTVFMNRCDYVDPALCWTGCKNTGRSGALSVIGFENLTRPKSYHLKKKTS